METRSISRLARSSLLVDLVQGHYPNNSSLGNKSNPLAGNRESLKKAFFDRDSMILWCLTNLGKVRWQYLQAMSDSRFSHTRLGRILSRLVVDELCGVLVGSSRIETAPQSWQ